MAQKLDEEGTAKIVIATNIAFTGMNITNCDLVISCGLTRHVILNTVTGLAELHDRPCSQEEEIGRARRTGRSGNVIYWQSESFRKD